MSFNHLTYLFPLIIFLILYIIMRLRSDRYFFSWVEDHWFYKRTKVNKLSSLLWIIGFSLICLALLDLRGPEKLVKGESVNQKTIILVDSSASMLAEDVRPNRFQKALLLVKHYIKKAVGQQISLVVFSDNQKRIIPFTEDMDLVKARINSLETMNLNRGGTGLSQAIQESIQYFKNTSDNVIGNILIFTDAEETEFGFDIEIPDSITVAVVGVGTRKGAPIPVRNSTGIYLGNKKYQGEVVTTKLDEDFMKKLGSIITNYRYWIATSYTIPTEEILEFFNRTNEVKTGESEFRVKPVMANSLLVPGFILLTLATLLNFAKVFIPVSLLFIFSINALANNPSAPEKKEPEKSALTLELEYKFAQDKLPAEGQKALAFNLLKDGFPQLSEVLYKEILESRFTDKNLNDHFNYSLAMIQNKKINEGVRHYADMLDYLAKYDGEEVKELRLMITKNVLKALEQQASSGEGKNDQQDENDQQQNSQQNSGEGNSDQQQDQQDQQNKDQDKDKDDQKKDQKGQQKQQQNKKNQKENQSKQDKKIEKQKIPAILKQLISDDNNLQKKLIDASTVERKSGEKKDW